MTTHHLIPPANGSKITVNGRTYIIGGGGLKLRPSASLSRR
jgi:hypothetical protein